jgi:hypothetical protein
MVLVIFMWTIVMVYAIVRGQSILAKWNLLEIWDILYNDAGIKLWYKRVFVSIWQNGSDMLDLNYG